MSERLDRIEAEDSHRIQGEIRDIQAEIRQLWQYLTDQRQNEQGG